MSETTKNKSTTDQDSSPVSFRHSKLLKLETPEPIKVDSAAPNESQTFRLNVPVEDPSTRESPTQRTPQTARGHKALQSFKKASATAAKKQVKQLHLQQKKRL